TVDGAGTPFQPYLLTSAPFGAGAKIISYRIVGGAMLHRIGLLILMINLVSVGSGQSRTPNVPIASEQFRIPLRLTIRTDRQSYTAAETMTVEVQLTNVSQSDVFIHEWDLCWNFARGLVMEIFDAKGTQILPNALLDCVPPP